jgi:2-dehydro-3-deoxygalactonokinase
VSESLIAIEWGTTQMRARLLRRDGETLDTQVETVRLADLGREGIVEHVARLRARWPHPRGPLLLSGMIGSAMGWEEIARVDCPAGPDAIADGAVAGRIGNHAVIFLPGLACEQRFGDPDVLRGEEVAAIGALEQSGGRAGLFLSVPGMHGKWLAHDGAQIMQFHTSMTVELYRVLAERSVLAPLMAAEPSEGAAFRAGVARGGEGGGLARLLFAARSNVQAGRMPAGDAASFLWGVMIGSDVRENIPLAPGTACLVAGAPMVAPLFTAAIRQLGGTAELGDSDGLTAAGFLRLAAILRAKGIFA